MSTLFNQQAKTGQSTSGSQKENPNPDYKQPLTPEMADLVIAELRYCRAIYLEAVQAMYDGVVLGAEQVQDKRIEFLEKGPTTDPAAQILLFAMTLVLEGTVGPLLAGLAIRYTLRPLMRSASKAISAQTRREMGSLAAEIRQLRFDARNARLRGNSFDSISKKAMLEEAGRLDKAADLLMRDLRGKSAEVKRVREPLLWLTNQTQNNLVALTKSVIAVNSAPGSDIGLSPGDTSGVAVQDAAMNSASCMRLALIKAHEMLETEIKKPGTTLGDAVGLLEVYRPEEALDLAEIRNSIKKSTELMIWARVLIDNEASKRTKGRAERVANNVQWFGDDKLHQMEQYLKLPGDEKLKQYLLARFDRELEAWALETNAFVPVLESPSPAAKNPSYPRNTGWWNMLNDSDKEDLLVQYLTGISSKTPAELRIW